MNVIGKSKQIRYLSGQIVALLGYVRHKIPLQVSNDINKYTDNLLSLYSAQKGKCRICGQELELEEIYCHHIIPKKLGGTDEYENLSIVHTDIHKLIHSTDKNEITKIISKFNLDITQIEKLNKFRKKLQLELV